MNNGGSQNIFTEIKARTVRDVLVNKFVSILEGKPPGFEKKIAPLVRDIIEKVPQLLLEYPASEQGSQEIRDLFDQIRNIDA